MTFPDFSSCTVSGQLLTIALARWLVAGMGGMGVGIAFLVGQLGDPPGDGDTVAA